MLYFAYGSNMSEKRLLKRIPAERLGTAVLHRHRLCFSKPSELDGSGKCDIMETGFDQDRVYGVIYRISPEHKPTLDEYEGLGYGYSSETVSVEFNNTILKVHTYKALNRDSALKPFCWYKRHVLEGARENNFPDDYIEEIHAIQEIKDPDLHRRARENAIYQ